MFVVPNTPNFVNYEKILSFIGASLKSDGNPASMPAPDPYHSRPQGNVGAGDRGGPHVEPHANWSQSPRSEGIKTANRYGYSRTEGHQPHVPPYVEENQTQQQQQDQRFQQQREYQQQQEVERQYQHQQQQQQAPPPQQQPKGRESPIQQKKRLELEGNQAKLLSILHDALKGYSREDFNRLVDAFYLWDREKKGSLTVDDIKTVAYRQNLRVTNSVINALLDLCYMRWDQYDWRKFVKYIEAALPSAEDSTPQVDSKPSRDGQTVRESLQQPIIMHQSMNPSSSESQTRPKPSPRAGASSPSSDAARAWFDRFMRLSKALYTVDSKYVGHLPPDDVRWVTNEYNRVYELGLYEPDVEEAVNVSLTHSGLVNIDSYLRSLSLRGHY